MTVIEHDRGDATESPSCSPLLSDWLSGSNREVISHSLRRCIGVDAYDLHADLTRFTFLLVHNDGEQLFGDDHP